jgi:hypothetical protein
MRVAIMQPYLFPYIGYIQMMNAVDHFVIYERAQYMKGGWINRNKILNKGSGKEQLFSFSVANSPVETAIIDKEWGPKFDLERKKFLRSLEQNYSKAPHFNSTFSLIEACLDPSIKSVGELIGKSLIKIAAHLEMETIFSWSADYDFKDSDPAQAKVLSILDHIGADHYINAIGGKELYDQDSFQAKGIQLDFIKAEAKPYEQYGGEFIPYLSIIDVLMFNGVEGTKELLGAYELVK